MKRKKRSTKARNKQSRRLTPQMTRKLLWTVPSALLLGIFSAAFSFAMVNDSRQPQIALAAYGDMPKAQSRLIDLKLNEALAASDERQARNGIFANLPTLLSPSDIDNIRQGALEGLGMTLLNAPALRQLAVVESDENLRRDLLVAARSVTRRDVLGAIQLAELELIENDLGSAMQALDRALVVSQRADRQVFPVLFGAARAPDLVGQVQELVSQDPEWAERMVRFAIENPQFLPAFSIIAGSLPADSVARQIGYGQQIVDRLVVDRQYDAAFAVYDAYAGAPQSLSSLDRNLLRPIDWRLTDNFDTGSRAFDDGVVEVFAEPARLGEFARTLTRLQPGRYALTLALASVEGSGEISLEVQCTDQANERRVAQVTAPIGEGAVRFSFGVPANCPHQFLVLVVSADEQAARAEITGARFARTSNAPASSVQEAQDQTDE